MHRLDVFWNTISRPIRNPLNYLRGKPIWPVTSGAYAIGDPSSSVAICTLTSNDLTRPVSRLSGVAIAGRLYTTNLGIEKIILNVISNPAIRFLILYGKESPVFHPGQALHSLFANGVTPDRRIIGAIGHMPELNNVTMAQIESFRQQIELVDCTDDVELKALVACLDDIAKRNPGRYIPVKDDNMLAGEPTKTRSEDFTLIKPGGRRKPLAYDAKGFFVITLDRKRKAIILRHFLADNSPAHEIRGRSAEGILLAALRENLISQMSHAGYLGAELSKAETALRLDLQYEQDQPLRQ